jgi:YVTN family beta-propeller protein
MTTIILVAIVLMLVVGVVLVVSSSGNLLIPYSLSRTTNVLGSAVSNLSSNALAGSIYVQNTNSNNISVVDPATKTVVKNVTLGSAPQHIELSEDQETLYILTTDRDSATIYKLNTTSNELMNDRISVPFSARNFAIFNDTIYLSNMEDGKVLRMNSNGTPRSEFNIASQAHSLEVRPDGKVLYVTRSGGAISVVDLEQNVLIKEINSSSIGHSISFDRSGARAFIVNDENDSVSVIDSQKHDMIKTIIVGDNPKTVRLNPDETLAYITNRDSNTVSILDARSMEVLDEIPAGKGPYGVAFSPDGGDLLYISNTKENHLSVIDTTSDKVITTIPAGGSSPSEIIAKNPEIEIVRGQNNNSNSYNARSFAVARLFVEIPDEPDEYERGLMFRQQLPLNAGMLFAFNSEEPRTFWMKNTVIPLDMIFIDSNSTIVDIFENVPPCELEQCPTYPSEQPAQYVLEVNAGFVNEKHVRIGDRLAISDDEAKGYDSR